MNYVQNFTGFLYLIVSSVTIFSLVLSFFYSVVIKSPRYRLLVVFTRIMYEIRSYLNRGTLDRLYHRHNVHFLSRWWNIGDPGKQTCKSLPTHECSSNWPFTRNKPLRQQVHKTLIHYPWQYWPHICLTIRNVHTWVRWTCRVKSVVSQVHDWVVHRLGVILGSVGHRVKIHKITPVKGKERSDLKIKDYVVLQKPQE